MPTLAKVRANDVQQGHSCAAVGRPVIRKACFTLGGKLYVLIVVLVLVLLTAAVGSVAQAGQPAVMNMFFQTTAFMFMTWIIEAP